MHFMRAIKSGHVLGVTALVVALAGSATASAGIVNIGGGWEASWDPSLDGLVDVTSFGVVGDAVVIQKSAEFTQGPVLGIFPSIPITFRQTAPGAVHNIVIDDEIITNSTGVTWTDFHMEVIDSGDAVFDPAATAASGGALPIGWTISPFTQAAFSSGNRKLDIWDGTVPNGSQWFPGNGVSDGQLWIAVNPHTAAPFTVFTLKESPTPEPVSVALLALGALTLLPKRRWPVA